MEWKPELLEEHNTKWVNSIAYKKVKKENLWQLKLAKLFAIIPYCIPDVSHQERLIAIVRYVPCDPEKEVFF